MEKPERLARSLTAALLAGVVGSLNVGCKGNQNVLVSPDQVLNVGTLGSIPKHVLTWAYDDTGAGGMGATSIQVQAFTNWAEERTQTPPGKAERDCYPGAGQVGCQAVWYIDASLLYSQQTPDRNLIAQLDSEHLTNDAGFYHNITEAVGDRVINSGPQVFRCAPSMLGPCYYDNLSKQNVIDFVVNCLVGGGSGAQCDNSSFRGPAVGTELFKDDNPAVCENVHGIGVYFHGGSSTLTPVELGAEPNCDRNLQKATLTFLAALKYPNGLRAKAFLNGYAPLCGNQACAYPTGDATYWTTGSAPALGVTDEGSVCSSATAPVIGFTGAIVLDDMAQLFNEAGSGYFIMLNYSTATAGSAAQLRMRRYCDGIFWLGYNISRSILWSNYSNGNRTMSNENILAVYPEQQIVPTNPVLTMSDVTTSTFGYNGTGCQANLSFDNNMRGGAHGLVVGCGLDDQSQPVGIYVREFHQCYSWASLIGSGQCAVVVNMTNQSAKIGGSSTKRWVYPDGQSALSLGYNEMLALSGEDVVTDNCSGIAGCPTGKGKDLNFGGSFSMYNTVVPSGDAVFLFHS